MNQTPLSAAEAKKLKFLRLLVSALTVTMIVGFLTIVALFVIRLGPNSQALVLPSEITLPDGVQATAFTRGSDWYALVTTSDEILIYTLETGELTNRISINQE